MSHFMSAHWPRRPAARNDARKPRQLNRRFGRHLLLLGAIIVVALLLAPFADVATPDYPEARAQADRLDAAYQSVWRGDASPEAAATEHGLSVYELPVGDRMTSLMTHAEPTAGGTCYGMRMGDGLATVAVKFAPTDGCGPHRGTAFRATGSWEDVLPSERMTAVWFVPALFVLISGAIILTTDIVLKLLSRTDQ